MGERIELKAADGFALGGYQALPDGEPRGGVVVIQEIFGVNDHIRAVADGYARDGFAVIAPQIFDRVERNVELGYGEADLKRGVELAFNGLDPALALADLQTTVDRLGEYGGVGVVGYCFGGLLSWRAACGTNGVQAAVCYYGGGIAREADRSARCPVMMHFGEQDAHIPLDDVEKIRRAQPEVQIYVYPADHGFNCDHRPSYHAESATLARSRTLSFFAEHLS